MEEEVETVDEISSKTWNVMENKLIKEGFREGAGVGRDQVFQSCFDEGYREGFKIGFNKGVLEGCLSVLSAEEHKEMIDTETKVLPSPCILCEDEIHKKVEGQSISEIENTLIKDDELHINALRNKYSDFLQKMGINLSSTSLANSRK